MSDRALVDVLLFTAVDDPHAQVVADALTTVGARVAVGNLASFAQLPMTISPGERVEVGDVRVDARSSVWYRRIGVPADVPGMGALEARLRREELAALVFGGLDAAGPRWVDRPDVVARAEAKLWQLAVASSLAVPVPPTLASSEPGHARTFAAAGPTLAKPASSGVGLAPFAEQLRDEDLEHLPACPTLLQRAVDAVADLRVVVVGQQGFIWRRERAIGQAMDWRAADAAGAGFRLVEDEPLAKSAVAVAGGLGLSMSVQDWVDDGRQCWFLEANPVGQWLFLDGAAELIGPAVADLLLGARS